MQTNPATRISRNSRRFTLIEMMTVVGIILLLSMIAILTVKYAAFRNSQALSKAVFSQLDQAFNQYRADWRYFPQQPQVANVPQPLTITFLQGLVKPNFSTGDPTGMYLQGCDRWTTGSNGTITNCVVDGFGSIIYYQCPGKVTPESFDMWSAGADYFFGAEPIDSPVPTTPDPKRAYMDKGGTVINKNIVSDDNTNWKRN